MTDRTWETELEATEAWLRDFDAVPGVLLCRAYEFDRSGLHLLAGERLRSDCCNAPSWTSLEGRGVTATRCDKCYEPCGTHWGEAGDDWPQRNATAYRPRFEVDREWIVRHAAEINRTSGFLVLRSDHVGPLLQLPGSRRFADHVASHWLPLYRLRGAAWGARKAG